MLILLLDGNDEREKAVELLSIVQTRHLQQLLDVSQALLNDESDQREVPIVDCEGEWVPLFCVYVHEDFTGSPCDRGRVLFIDTGRLHVGNLLENLQPLVEAFHLEELILDYVLAAL